MFIRTALLLLLTFAANNSFANIFEKIPLQTKELLIPSGSFGAWIDTGDFNGDGLNDLAIGTPAQTGQLEDGQVAVFINSQSGFTEPMIITIQESSTRFGDWITSLGDINGDGFDDLGVTATRATFVDAPQSSGKIYIYYGGNQGLTTEPDLVINSSDLQIEFLRSLRAAGDLNFDGYDDFIVGVGLPTLFFGSGAGPSMQRTYSFTAPANMSPFVRTGDINGDGIDDLLLSKSDFRNGDGAVFEYFGASQSVEFTNSKRLNVPGSGNGGSLTTGDINDDGYNDLIVGKSTAQGGSTANVGRVYYFLGSSNGLPESPSFQLSGSGENNYFGGGVKVLGDLDADGFNDYAVRSGRSSFSTDSLTRLYFGSDDPENPIILTDYPSIFNITPIGDVNSDGFADVVMTSVQLDEQTNRYSINIYTGATRNQPPILNNSPPSTGLENELYEYTPDVVDPENEQLTFSFNGQLPEWATFDPSNGSVSGVPGFYDAGTYLINIFIDDPSGNRIETGVVVLEIENNNRLPIFTSTPQTQVDIGANFSYQVEFTDEDNDNQLALTVSALPSWLSFNSETNTLSGTPTPTNEGSNQVSLLLSDGIDQISQNFVLNVERVSEVAAESDASGGSINFGLLLFIFILSTLRQLIPRIKRTGRSL